MKGFGKWLLWIQSCRHQRQRCQNTKRPTLQHQIISSNLTLSLTEARSADSVVIVDSNNPVPRLLNQHTLVRVFSSLRMVPDLSMNAYSLYKILSCWNLFSNPIIALSSFLAEFKTASSTAEVPHVPEKCEGSFAFCTSTYSILGKWRKKRKKESWLQFTSSHRPQVPGTVGWHLRQLYHRCAL